MQLINDIWPETRNFLTKFSDTFLSEFIFGKINIDDSSEYNEKNVDKYLSNVQDYSKLIHEWEKSTKENKESEKELDLLREEMKFKLGKFEQSRLLPKDLYQSMESDYKKGIRLDEIIRKNSQKIALDIQNPYSKSTVITKNNIKKKNPNISIATTEAGNYRYGNDSNITNNQQSSIIAPNNSSTSNKNNSKVSNTPKEAEYA